jgi:hypothetical protein
VAEAKATDLGDELVVDINAVADPELPAYGAAVWSAIELAAAADEAREQAITNRAEQRGSMTKNWFQHRSGSNASSSNRT